MQPSDQNPPPLRPEEMGWGLFCHASFLIGLGVIVPWLVYRNQEDKQSPLGRHALEALNYHITIYFYLVLCVAMIPILVGLFLLFGLMVTAIGICLIAILRAWQGATVHYPLCMRLIKPPAR